MIGFTALTAVNTVLQWAASRCQPVCERVIHEVCLPALFSEGINQTAVQIDAICPNPSKICSAVYKGLESFPLETAVAAGALVVTLAAFRALARKYFRPNGP